MITVYLILHTLGTVVANTISVLDTFSDKALKRQDEALCDYCINRVVIICPECRMSFRVSGLDEQMNVEWKCACCGRTFREHATHTERR